MAFGAGLLERARDQRLTDAPLAKRRLDRQRTEQQRFRLADPHRRQPHRSDQQRADARGERQIEAVRHLLAQTIGGLGVAARAEGALMQPLDRRRVALASPAKWSARCRSWPPPSICAGSGPAERASDLRSAGRASVPAAKCLHGGRATRSRSTETMMGLLVDGAWQDVGYARSPGRPIRPQADGIPQLCHRRRQSRPDRQGRICRRARPLSSLRLARLPVGASHADLSQAEKARERDLGVGHRRAARQEGLGIRHRARRDARHRQRQVDACGRSMCSPIRTTAAAPACRCCGTRNSAPSSTTNRPKSSACSIRHSTRSPTCARIITRPNCAARSIASTTSSIRP